MTSPTHRSQGRRRTWTRFVALLAAIALSASACGDDDTRDVRLNFGVITSSSSHYLHFVAKANVVNEYAEGITITVVAAGSPAENVPRMVTGEFDLVNYSPAAGRSQYEGTGSSEGNAVPNLRIWFNDVEFSNLFLVREDAGIETIADLEGQPFNPGIPGSTAEREANLVFQALGITPDLRPASLEDAVNAMRNREIVGYTKATGVGGRPDASMLELEAAVGLTALTFTPEQVEILKAALPQYVFTTIPASVAPDFYPTDILAIGNGLGQAVLAEFDADVLYDMTKAIFDHQDEIEQAYPGYGDFDLAEQTLKYATIPLHTGMVRYLQDIGVEVPAELIPPEYTP